MKRFGQLQLKEFKEMTTMPQWLASNYDEIFKPELTGAKFKLIMYCAEQLAHGTDHFFIAERIIPYADEPFRNLVLLAINEMDGEYKLVKDSITKII